MTPPTLDNDSGPLKAEEDLAVEQFVAKPCIEALDVAVLPGAAGGDVRGLRAQRGEPPLYRLGGELRERRYPAPYARGTTRPAAR